MNRLEVKSSHSNAAIDITKLIMAYLVVAIHTEPFGFSFWLDKGFGIFTRICVPFFFVASSYFFFSKNNNPIKYLKRIFTLYFVWSVIYLPFDIPELKESSITEILVKYFWVGNGHALWYLCGSLVGFIIVYGLSRIMSPKRTFAITVLLLIIGCFKSTYAPIVEELFAIEITDVLGSRNELFYASTYYALGLLIAKEKDSYSKVNISNIVGFIISFIALGIESLVLVWIFKTQATVLWISVLPLTYNFFLIIKNVKSSIDDRTSYFIRKMSTLIYVSHCFFMYLFANLEYCKLFVVVSFLSTLFSITMIILSKQKRLKWIKTLL